MSEFPNVKQLPCAVVLIFDNTIAATYIKGWQLEYFNNITDVINTVIKDKWLHDSYIKWLAINN